MSQWKYLPLVLACMALQTACGGDPDRAEMADAGVSADAGPAEDASPSGAVDLEGLWQVSGSSIPEGSTVTFEFGAEASGTVSSLIFESASGITTCDERPYALLVDGTLLLDGLVMTIESSGPDELILTGADGALTATLTRVVGEAPIEPCRELEVSLIGYSRQYVAQHSQLDTYDGKLYFTSDVSGRPIVTYDVAEQQVFEERDSSYPSFAVIGVVDDSFMLGGIFAGRSDTVDHFDLAANTHDLVTLTTQEGDPIFMKAGAYDRDEDRLKVAALTDDGDHLLLTYDPATKTVESQRPFLPGASIRDIAVGERDMVALVGNSTLVFVGEDGLATDSFQITGIDGFLQGIAVVGPTAYLMTDWGGEAVIYTTLLR